MATSSLVSVLGRLAENAVYSSCYFIRMLSSFGTVSLSLAFSSELRSRYFLEHLPRGVAAGSPMHSLESTFLSVLTV